MGHGDELVLADANFPTSSICACGPKEIRADGLGIPQLLKAILKLLSLDTYVPSPAAVMDLLKERCFEVHVWYTYSDLLNQAGSYVKKLVAYNLMIKLISYPIEKVERFAFYERAKEACIFSVETALYGNLIQKKGVISPDLLE
ncbi:fucose mutarotase [Notothenia coriiceps]|uniref:L-fucose mutarotase n=1 Tax=Notothenia coriiceps TaxID=8208 RepID=A0A6I9PRA1_9TELE|nr:PREDICTED: fucose mutarotase [Notothenia coriiceps]